MCGIKAKRWRICCGVSGIILLVLGIVSIPVLIVIIKQQVVKHVMLVEDTEVYEQWKYPTVPIYVQVYMFDLQNPEQFRQGAKPFLVQKGPYTYREHRKKVDIRHNDNATVTYREIRTYHFVRNMSVGPDTDNITTINIPLVGFAEGIRWESPTIKKMGNLLLNMANEKLFMTRTIAEIVWGYEDPLLHLGKQLMPNWFYTDLVGAMAGKNDTDDGVFTVFTGEDDIHKVGIIDKYNGSSYLPFWSTPYANKINGTDGSIAPPFLTKDELLFMFNTEACRSAYAVYNGTMKSPQGIDLYRYVAPRELMLAPPGNPDNEGFCVPLGNCMASGALNITSCMTVDHFPIPLVLSLPNFYMGPSYRKAVDGMHPDPAQHNTYLGVEPTTGIVMNAAKRLQVNIFVPNDPNYRELEKVASVVYPILWVNESVIIDDYNARKMWLMFLLPVQIAHVAQYSMVVIGSLILLCITAQLLHIYITDRKRRQELEHNAAVNSATPTETSPLLKDHS